ncbi:hypothetical protein LTR94_034661, partial [Friedmanniomyces endolithicus]
MSGLYGAVKLVLTEGGAAGLAWAPSIVSVNFDKVRAGSDLASHHAHDRIAVSLFCAERYGDAWLKALGAIGACGDNGAAGDEHSGTRNNSLVDGALQAGVCIASALRSK